MRRRPVVVMRPEPLPGRQGEFARLRSKRRKDARNGQNSGCRQHGSPKFTLHQRFLEGNAAIWRIPRFRQAWPQPSLLKRAKTRPFQGDGANFQNHRQFPLDSANFADRRPLDAMVEAEMPQDHGAAEER